MSEHSPKLQQGRMHSSISAPTSNSTPITSSQVNSTTTSANKNRRSSSVTILSKEIVQGLNLQTVKVEEDPIPTSQTVSSNVMNPLTSSSSASPVTRSGDQIATQQSSMMGQSSLPSVTAAAAGTTNVSATQLPTTTTSGLFHFNVAGTEPYSEPRDTDAVTYLETRVFPKLMPALEKLLVRVQRKETHDIDPNAQVDPLNWLAQYLYRSNRPVPSDTALAVADQVPISDLTSS